jgi:hypothetical protein
MLEFWWTGEMGIRKKDERRERGTFYLEQLLLARSCVLSNQQEELFGSRDRTISFDRRQLLSIA